MRAPRHGKLQPDDPFFSREDHEVFKPEKSSSSLYDGERQRVRDKFLALHDVLYPEIKRRGWDLHPHWYAPSIVSTWYVGRIQNIRFMKLRYLRSKDEVHRVERMMGIPPDGERSETRYIKHPLMDIRIDSKYLAVELLLTDQAWWDAQNFKRKLEHHGAERRAFIDLLRGLGTEYVFGGWPDSREPELNTNAAKLTDDDELVEWLARFEPGDWLRLGIWYNVQKSRLPTQGIAEEIIKRFAQLYPIYEFLLWTPENDYR